ncbi:MAG: alpha amylase C-terminal domain-containing protein [Victivallales bacterium]|nr:alpha amylase C-terminal domain-containing protein [Victivallales bacterium]
MTLDDVIFLDGGLAPYRQDLQHRWQKVQSLYSELKGNKSRLCEAMDWHLRYGLHFTGKNWSFCEWLPNATQVWLVGDFSNWQIKDEYKLTPGENGEWHGTFDTIRTGQQYRMFVRWNGGEGYRLPSAVRHLARSTADLSRNDVKFNAIAEPALSYHWRHSRPAFPKHPLIYEAHVGMAQENGGIGTFEAFRINVLPRIAKAGYNVLQLMALAQHPYYASFGYHVSNFFAVQDCFGIPEEFCRLVDEAHGLGICVTMDLVHSHAASNTEEGIAQLDGTEWQFFHNGPKGTHPGWGSKCFDYDKRQTLRFLLSNCRFWLEEYHLEGFRFDGITSMLYWHHGLGKMSWTYAEDFFGKDLDEAALAYLTLANMVAHEALPGVFTVAEDVSGMPGLCLPPQVGGAGFDCRLAMGITDLWFKLADLADEDWQLGQLWYELNSKRPEEHTISYVESHDQALVGGKTFAFALADRCMYDAMAVNDQSLQIDRMLALHKMARLLTFATSDTGYLNFMGNEFGHPEWIDFPSQRNNWSFDHARRQWSLVDDHNLKYHFLADFDQAMLQLTNDGLFSQKPQKLLVDETRHLIAFERSGFIFLFNFSANVSYTDLKLSVFPGSYQPVLDTDAKQYGGFARILHNQTFFTIPTITNNTRQHCISVYLPARTALVLKQRR